MEINEATCLCRFGGCEVLREAAHAESNYWSVTSRSLSAPRPKLLCARICWHLYWSAAEWHVCTITDLKALVLLANTGLPLYVGPMSRCLWEREISSSPIHHLRSITQKTHSSSETVGPPQCFCLSVVWLSVSHLHSIIHTHTHTRAHFLCLISRPHHSDPPHSPLVGVVR